MSTQATWGSERPAVNDSASFEIEDAISANAELDDNELYERLNPHYR